MSFVDLLLFCVKSLWGHRLRTLLSLAGMSIGVAAVILMTSLGEGAKRYVVEQFSSLGSNLIVVMPGRNETTGAFPGLAGVPNDLTLRDTEAVLRSVPEVIRAAPLVAATESVAFGERRRQVAVMGSSHDMILIQDFQVARGSFLPSGDLDRGGALAVLGSTTARELFQEEDALGKTIRIGDRRFRVIGVLASRGLQVGIDFDDIVIIPVATAMQIFNRHSLLRLLLQTHAYADLEAAKDKIRAVVIDRHGEQDFSVLTQDAVISTLSLILTALTLALAGIAAVSLSVAGIGIMNVMLVSVSERTSEVGLLKALGVGRGQVQRLFLTEAALLSTSGGALGVALGVLLARLIVTLYPAFPAQAPTWAVIAALAVALLFGLVFGVMPARRAARLDPIVALARR